MKDEYLNFTRSFRWDIWHKFLKHQQSWKVTCTVTVTFLSYLTGLFSFYDTLLLSISFLFKTSDELVKYSYIKQCLVGACLSY